MLVFLNVKPGTVASQPTLAAMVKSLVQLLHQFSY